MEPYDSIISAINELEEAGPKRTFYLREDRMSFQVWEKLRGRDVDYCLVDIDKSCPEALHFCTCMAASLNARHAE